MLEMSVGDDLKDGDESPQQTVEVFTLADARDCRTVGHFVTELTAEQIHTENTTAQAHN